MSDGQPVNDNLLRINGDTLRPGSKLEIEHALRGKLCLLEDGTLYVAAAYQGDDSVLAYIDLLRRSGAQFKLSPVSPEVIEKIYSRIVAFEGGRRDNTERQSEVISIIKDAIKLGASDIHFINGRQRTEIKFRVDGMLITDRRQRDKMTLAVDHGQALCGALFQSMCEHSGGSGAGGEYNPKRPQDARMKLHFADMCGMPGARFASRPSGAGNMVVLRLFYRSEVKGFQALGYEPSQVAMWNSFVYRRRGVYLISGPTGSGKTTTLYAAASSILEDAEHRINLMTIEDPIESELLGANQTPLIVDLEGGEGAEERAWLDAIRNCVRMDPDVLIVGEIRDRESAKAGLEFAMTGHGLLGSVHTESITEILDRFTLSMGIPIGAVTGGIIRGLVNQSLVPLNCPACRRPYTRARRHIPKEARERIERFCDPDRIFLRGTDRGCPNCRGMGIKGRSVVSEMCETNEPFFRAYVKDGAARARRYWIDEMGGFTKSMHLEALINRGLVDPVLGEQEVCLLSDDREDFRNRR